MLVIMRLMMVAGCTIAGVVIAAMVRCDPHAVRFAGMPAVLVVLWGAGAGMAVGALGIFAEFLLRKVSLGTLLVVAAGLALGWALTDVVVILGWGVYS